MFFWVVLKIHSECPKAPLGVPEGTLKCRLAATDIDNPSNFTFDGGDLLWVMVESLYLYYIYNNPLLGVQGEECWANKCVGLTFLSL